MKYCWIRCNLLYRNLRSLKRNIHWSAHDPRTHTHTLTFRRFVETNGSSVFALCVITAFSVSVQLYRQYDKLIWWARCVQPEEKNNSIWHIIVLSRVSLYSEHTHTGTQILTQTGTVEHPARMRIKMNEYSAVAAIHWSCLVRSNECVKHLYEKQTHHSGIYSFT